MQDMSSSNVQTYGNHSWNFRQFLNQRERGCPRAWTQDKDFEIEIHGKDPYNNKQARALHENMREGALENRGSWGTCAFHAGHSRLDGSSCFQATNQPIHFSIQYFSKSLKCS